MCDDDEDERGVPSAPRGYTHRACGESTSLSGTYLLALCNPFSATVGTFCAECDDHFPLKEFTWDDTGERLSAARRRHAALAPAWVRGLLRPAGCLSFVVLCGLAAAGPGYAVGRLLGAPPWVFPVVAGLGGAAVSLFVLGGVLAPAITRRYYGLDDWRELR